ncbi:hypothetical protein AAG906_011257 [Vitis piasezkii]
MEDYLRFSEVCIEWQYAVREKFQHLRSNHKRHCRLHQKERCCLYDVMTGKSLWEFQLRLGRSKCEGSSHGWLILVEDDSYKVTLFNPCSSKLIHLPPLENQCLLNILVVYMRKVSFFPEEEDEFVLMMTCDGFIRRVAFIKSGEEDWTYIEGLQDVKDIVYSNGLFYVLDGWGVLFSCDVSKDLKVRRITSPEDLCGLVLYLVESPKEISYGSMVFKESKMGGGYEFGRCGFVLGENHSTSVIASDFAGCRPNSIYFIKPCRYPNDSYANVYVLSLNDRTVTRLYPRSRSPLLWISPKFS